jgi:hypothetical protein
MWETGDLDDHGSGWRMPIRSRETKQPADRNDEQPSGSPRRSLEKLGRSEKDLSLNSWGPWSLSLFHPGVRWLLLAERIVVLPEQIDAFTALYDHNYRPTQPLNGSEDERPPMRLVMRSQFAVGWPGTAVGG